MRPALVLCVLLAACAPKPTRTPLPEWQTVTVTGPPDHYTVCMDDPPPATVEECSGWRTVYVGRQP